MKDFNVYIHERAESFGLTLDPVAVAAIRRKWESDPLCNLDGLLSGIRMLGEKNHRNCLQLADEVMLKCCAE